MMILLIIALSTILSTSLASVCIETYENYDPRNNILQQQRFTKVSEETSHIYKKDTIQSKVRTSPNCLFPHYDEKLLQWDAGSFCMEETLTGGACIGDLNMDGYDDLYYPRMDGSDILYLNLKNGSFQDITTQAKLKYDHIRSNGCIIFDIDNDGDNDIYISTVGDVRFYLFVKVICF